MRRPPPCVPQQSISTRWRNAMAIARAVRRAPNHDAGGTSGIWRAHRNASALPALSALRSARHAIDSHVGFLEKRTQSKSIFAVLLSTANGTSRRCAIVGFQTIAAISRARSGAIAESARGISPRAAHISGLKPLDLSGSCQHPKAAAFRCTLGSSLCRLTQLQPW